jgi:hypothetical protein
MSNHCLFASIQVHGTRQTNNWRRQCNSISGTTLLLMHQEEIELPFTLHSHNTMTMNGLVQCLCLQRLVKNVPLDYHQTHNEIRILEAPILLQA